MTRDTKIEWAHDTVNFWWGCTEVSPACDFCYARELDARYRFGGQAHWGTGADRWERVEKAAAELKKNNKLAAKTGERRRQFINSMSDFFEDREDLDPLRLAALDAFALCDNLDILLLTKRASRIMPILERMLKDARYLHRRSPGFDVLTDWVVDGVPPANLWLGTTCENQKWLELRSRHLFAVPAAVRFLSCEPLLGGLDLQAPFNAWWNEGEGTRPAMWPALHHYLHWVIAGGESDWKRPSRARPMHPDWAYGLRDQCILAGVAFHFKQWGDWLPMSDFSFHEHGDANKYPTLNVLPDGRTGDQVTRAACDELKTLPITCMCTGKKIAGRAIADREWNEVPKTEQRKSARGLDYEWALAGARTRAVLMGQNTIYAALCVILTTHGVSYALSCLDKRPPSGNQPPRGGGKVCGSARARIHKRLGMGRLARPPPRSGRLLSGRAAAWIGLRLGGAAVLL